jgi:hypothetical protein
MSEEKKYFVVWERRKGEARVYNRKLSAIYDHIRFKVKQQVWFLDGLTAEQVKLRLRGQEYTYIREEV